MITYEETISEQEQGEILLRASKNSLEDEFLLTIANDHIPLPAGKLEKKLKPMGDLKSRIISLGFQVQETTKGWRVFK